MNARLFLSTMALSAALLGASVDAQDVGCANKLSAAAFDTAQTIFNTADNVHYEHAKRPAGDQVQYVDNHCAARTDCSGFVSYVLQTVSPRHYEQLHQMQPERRYPQAAAFEQFFASLGNGVQNGWQRVETIRDLRPGDIIAWAKPQPTEPLPPGQKKGNSGHVMFVAAPASAPETLLVGGKQIRFVSIRVLDSSSVRHFPPEQLPPRANQSERDGVGFGSVRLVIDENEQPIGYWEGTYWAEGQKELRRPTYTREIAFGRPVPLQ